MPNAPSPHPLFLHAQNRLRERLGDMKEPPSGDGKLSLSCLELHHDGALPARLAALYHKLNKGGLFHAVMMGGQSLHELRTSLMEAELALTGGAATRVMPMLAADEAARLLPQAGFALPVVDHERVTLTYDTLPALLDDLRRYRCAALKPPASTPCRLFTEAAPFYAKHFPASSGGITATVDLLFLHGWKEDA